MRPTTHRPILRALVAAVLLGLVTGNLAPPAGAVEVLINGGFETGDLTGWTTTDNPVGGFGGFFATADPFTPLSANGTPGPASGGFYVVSDQTGHGAHALAQHFTVPGASRVTLSFDMFVNDWSGLGPILGPGLDPGADPDPAKNPANQNARVDLLTARAGFFNTGGGVLVNLFRGIDAPGTNPNPYTHYSFDITGLAGGGGTFVLRFAEVDNRGFLNQGVDNVSIEARSAAVPVPATLTLVGTGVATCALALRRRRGRLG